MPHGLADPTGVRGRYERQTWKNRALEAVYPIVVMDAIVLKVRENGRVICTTNAIESLNASLRKVANPRGHFSTDDAALKILYLAIRNRTAKWKRPPKGWSSAIQHLTIHFPDRILP